MKNSDSEELEHYKNIVAQYKSELQKVQKEIATIQREAESQVQLLRAIHSALVPTDLPHIHGFEFSTKFVPGSEVGGDYFDIFDQEERFKFGMVLSSAKGHSMSALLLSVLLKVTGPAYLQSSMTAAETLTEVFKEYRAKSTEDSLPSIFYGLFDRKFFNLQFCCTGNIAVIHYPYNSELAEVIYSRDMQKGHDFESADLKLNSRDCLVVLSEGLCEVFGTEGIQKEILPIVKQFSSQGSHAIRHEILFRAQNAEGPSSPPKRDLSVVVTQVKDKVIKLATST